MNSQILTKINNFVKNRLVEFLGVVLVFISIFLLASIASYSPSDPNFIYELEFEKLVNNPVEESKNVMKFCELTWDKKCLEFYKRKDLISKTASNIQIRQAIYKHSLEKYLPYKKFLNQYGEKYSWFK